MFNACLIFFFSQSQKALKGVCGVLFISNATGWPQHLRNSQNDIW